MTTTTPATKSSIPAPKVFLGVGAVMVIVAIALNTIPFTISASGISQSNTVPQWNGLCTSEIGLFAQNLEQTAHTACTYVSAADHAIGWLVGLGVAALVIGLVGLLAAQRNLQQS
jgi:hypothetical protein